MIPAPFLAAVGETLARKLYDLLVEGKELRAITLGDLIEEQALQDWRCHIAEEQARRRLAPSSR